MTKNNLEIGLWGMLGLLALCIVITVVGGIHSYRRELTEDMVDKIHSKRLDFSDVDGSDLPTDPGIENDATLQGIDANNNAVRDDVELSIFKAYPDQMRIRAVLLQYASVLQEETMYPLNDAIATAIAQEDSRAYDCIGTIVPQKDNDIQTIEGYRAFVKGKQLNTVERKNTQESFDEQAKSFKLQSGCDINTILFSNL